MAKTTKKKKEFRSGSERRSSALLIAEGIKHEYEPHFIQYEVSLVRRYLPDFIFKYCKGPAIPVEWIEENHDNNNKARRIASRRLKKSSDRLKKRNST